MFVVYIVKFHYLHALFCTSPHYQAGIEISSQQNFSGDSQDSRGYTSISVREPLAAIKAQTRAANANQTTGGQPGEGEGYCTHVFYWWIDY